MSAFIFVFVTLCALVLSTLAVPLSGVSPNTIDLTKRATHTGRGTWFYPGLGNCGETDSDSSMIVAMSKDFYDANNGGNCNQRLTITNTANGKTVSASMHDSCPGCSYYDLDMSPAVFQELATLDQGVIEISWHFDAK